MLGYLILLFIILPFIELALLLKLADATRWEFALGLVVVTGIVGAALARSQGLRTWYRIQSELSQGRIPTQALMDGVMILVAGALLITPGIITDVFGFSLLLPPCRYLYRQWLKRRFHARIVTMHGGMDPESPDENRSRVIDSYVVDERSEED